MSTANIDVRVNSSELNGLINRLQEAEQSLDDVRRSADQAANSVDKVGNATSGAAGEVQGFSISGARAAAAGAAMGVAMVAAEKAMELAAAAAAAINQATIDYIRTSQAGRAAIDGYTDALERSKQEIAKAIADTGLYQKAAEGLTQILPQLTEEIVKGIGAIEDAVIIYMEYKDVIDGVVGVLQNMIPGLQSVLTILEAGKVVWNGTVQALDYVATAIETNTTELEQQAPAVDTATTAWDRLTGALNNNLESTIQIGQQYRATAAVSELAGNIVGFFRGTVRTTTDEIDNQNTSLSRSTRLHDDHTEAVDTAAQAQAGLAAAMQITARATQQAEQAAIRESERMQQEAARREEILAQYRADRQREIRQQSFDETQAALEDSLAELLDPAQERMNMLFGGGDLDELMERTDKFSNRLTTNLLNMSDEGAASLGVLNTAMNDLAGGFGAAFGEALMSGERVDKALKKSLAGMLSSLGQTYLAQGAALLIPPPFNPIGNPAAGGTMIGVGGAMLGLSAAFGGGGGKKSPSTPASTTPGQTQTQYTSVNFGFVGDRRAAGREVADVQEDARRRGL
jgi:hypothetical protein